MAHCGFGSVVILLFAFGLPDCRFCRVGIWGLQSQLKHFQSCWARRFPSSSLHTTIYEAVGINQQDMVNITQHNTLRIVKPPVQQLMGLAKIYSTIIQYPSVYHASILNCGQEITLVTSSSCASGKFYLKELKQQKLITQHNGQCRMQWSLHYTALPKALSYTVTHNPPLPPQISHYRGGGGGCHAPARALPYAPVSKPGLLDEGRVPRGVQGRAGA